jgi:hypothetical protein
MCIKSNAIAIAIALASGCGPQPATATTGAARFSGTLTSCKSPNPRGGDVALPDRQALLVIADDGAAFADRVKPTTTTSDGWSVDDAAVVKTNDGTKLDVDGTFVENCDADGGCRSVPWSLVTKDRSGTFTDGPITCNATLEAK